MTILVLGSTGQLASHLRELLPGATFWSRAEADLGQPASLAAAIIALRPTAIVNAAAHTAVDRAESEPDLAWRVNAEAPAAMARAAQALDIPLIQVSTDYVFDGSKDGPYVVTDPVAPISVYGRSKLGGELAVQTLCTKHWILRTSWVFSEFGHNFVKTMLRLARERETLSVVDDQHGQPTYAGDLARLIRDLLRDGAAAPTHALPWGRYHVGSGPVVTWRDFAERIVGLAGERGLIGRVPTVAGIPTSAYPTPARRPRNSVLASDTSLTARYPNAFDWPAGLDTVLARSGPPGITR
jgi:dTDP-4-dehydrorhamnose reductase